MSINSLLGVTINPSNTTQPASLNASSNAGANSFAATFAALSNSVNYTDDQIKKSFATTSTPDAFAKQAASMQLNESQIQPLMATQTPPLMATSNSPTPSMR